MEEWIGLFSILGVGVAILTARDHWQRGTSPVDPDQLVGRHGPSDDRPQIAGSKCAYCEQKILTTTEAVLCKVCKRPVHAECRKDHRRDAHRERPRAAYR